jgi:glycosyltransferase involved in cell wall biosynthesis
MISFVWAAKNPFLAGRGGSENYTAGQVRELMRRGIPTRIITIGFGTDDGRDGFPDITFTALESKKQLSQLEDTLVGVIYPIGVPTKRPSYTILHCPLTTSMGRDTRFNMDDFALGSHLIAPSKFAAKMWATTLRTRPNRIPAVHPFADPCFSKVKRPANTSKKTRILFAGRLLPDKGIFTLLAALHMPGMSELDYELTVTRAAATTDAGPVISAMLEANPMVNLVDARKTPQAMAELMAQHDIVLMPSSDIFWKEIFGIVSVEAQHAGCRVVASNAGGIPETDCGGLMLVRPDDPLALANGIAKAAALGPLTKAERLYASNTFTVQQSVDKLLHVINTAKKQPLPLLHKQGALVREQLDFAIDAISELSLRVTGKNQLP